MERFDNLEDVAHILEDGGPFNPDIVIETVSDLVDELVKLGDTDKVFVKHDDHLGLKNELTNDYLHQPIDKAMAPEYEEQRMAILDQANTIIHLSTRQLTEEDQEEIEEDKLYRGENTDE